MKRYPSIILIVLLLTASAGCSDIPGYETDKDLTLMTVISILLTVASIALSITIFMRWWKMTATIERISKCLEKTDTSLVYLVAFGKKDEAQEAAQKALFDTLYQIYTNTFEHFKAKTMNEAIAPKIEEAEKLGLTIPEFMTSGEKFIDHINAISGNKVPYDESY